jgi:excisionase family DNA binding protein
MTASNEIQLIGIKAAAEMLDVPVGTLYKQWENWGIPAYRVGRAIKFRLKDILRWQESNRAGKRVG